MDVVRAEEALADYMASRRMMTKLPRSVDALRRTAAEYLGVRRGNVRPLHFVFCAWRSNSRELHMRPWRADKQLAVLYARVRTVCACIEHCCAALPREVVVHIALLSCWHGLGPAAMLHAGLSKAAASLSFEDVEAKCHSVVARSRHAPA